MMLCSQAKVEEKICIFRFSCFSVDTVSSKSKGGEPEAVMPDAFASNHLVDDVSHPPVKSPKHL